MFDVKRTITSYCFYPFVQDENDSFVPCFAFVLCIMTSAVRFYLQIPVLDSILGKPRAISRDRVIYRASDIFQRKFTSGAENPWENKQTTTIDLILWMYRTEDDLKLHFGPVR